MQLALINLEIHRQTEQFKKILAQYLTHEGIKR
jgi:hypothetical protein